MNFPEDAYLATALSAVLGTVLTMPFWRWLCIRTGHVDDPGHRKIHDKPISLAGGLGVLTGFMTPILGGFLVLASGWLTPETSESLQYGFAQRKLQLLAIFGGALEWWYWDGLTIVMN